MPGYKQVKALNKASKNVYESKENKFTTALSEEDLQKRNWYLYETNVSGAVPKYVYRKYSDKVTQFIEELQSKEELKSDEFAFEEELKSEEGPSDTIFIYKNRERKRHETGRKMDQGHNVTCILFHVGSHFNDSKESHSEIIETDHRNLSRRQIQQRHADRNDGGNKDTLASRIADKGSTMS